MERVIVGEGYHPSHFENEWWRGYNDAAQGRGYDNIYVLHTSRWEYQQGYLNRSGYNGSI